MHDNLFASLLLDPKQEDIFSRLDEREDDKYAQHGIPSDPIYAVFAEKPGKVAAKKPRPSAHLIKESLMNKEDLEEKKKQIHKTLRCPHCDEKMKKWAVPENPFEATWANEFLYICFNDNCPYYVRGWDHIFKSTSRIASYRFMYNQEKDTCAPIPVPSPKALRESIIN